MADPKPCSRDYIVATHTFTVGVETKTHAVVRTALAKAIGSRIDQLAAQHPDTAIGRFAAKIVDESNAATPLQDLPTKNSHDPDISFVCEDAKYPGIVIEVAHSQRQEDLPHVAREYLLGSMGNIHCVHGIKIECRSGKQAWLSAWESRIDALADGSKQLSVEQTVENQMASVIAHDIAQIPRHFAQIRITAEELCQILDRAEGREAKAKDGLVQYGAGELLVERPELPAPERVSGDGQKKYRDAEKRVAQRCDEEDPDPVE